MTVTRRTTQKLRSGLIFEIARAAGLEIPTDRNKVTLGCPFHEDKHPSAVLFATNTFFCSSCGRRLIAREFATELKIPWPFNPKSCPAASRTAPPATRSAPTPPAFSPADARRTWDLALARGRLDPPDPGDGAAYAYLSRRGLAAAFDEGVYGILGEGIDLHPSIAWWPRNGYQVVSPLFDASGEIANIQSRAIIPVEKKTRFPAGSRAAGTVFANAAAQQLLRYRTTTDPRVVVVEGLTDFLAMCVVTSVPVVGVPGAEFFKSAFQDWVRGRDVLVAPDIDDAGNRVIDDLKRVVYGFGAATVNRLVWPMGCKDACDALAKVGAEDLMSAVDRCQRKGGRS